ncbi:uncharacterized protein LOC142591473 [Dermacentor variabilis]|uniref:uncharacterized protein LOC142591473 n=1 Tax=Dermacentor variabilis TaxID=34621 RepID=UPI003F5B7038
MTHNWCAQIGLDISKDKVMYMSVANKNGRRPLALRPLQLTLDQQLLHEASTLRVLGLEMDSSGSAGPWVKNAKEHAAETAGKLPGFFGAVTRGDIDITFVRDAQQHGVELCGFCPLDERAPTIESVICTVDGEHWLDVPPDGVCQFIFFNSLKAPFENLALSTPAGFANFKRFAAMGNQTQFGVSIYALQTDDFLAHINKPTAKEWAKKQLWDFNIYHWGVMNMHKVITGLPDYFENALLSLKRAAHISKLTAKKEVASYTFIGFYGEKQVACEKAAQHFKKIYRPHVVVFLGHISFKEQEITSEVPNFVCIILPPTIYKIPPKIKQKLVYGHTYEEAAKMVTCISQKGINPPPVYAVSVTLQARSYTPKVDDTNEHKIGAYAVFQECDRFREYATPHGVSTMMQDQRCTVHQK